MQLLRCHGEFFGQLGEDSSFAYLYNAKVKRMKLKDLKNNCGINELLSSCLARVELCCRQAAWRLICVVADISARSEAR